MRLELSVYPKTVFAVICGIFSLLTELGIYPKADFG